MKTSTKIKLGLIAVSAVAAFTAGVVYELKKIKKITADEDDVMEEENDEAVDQMAAEAVEEPAEAEEPAVNEVPVTEKAPVQD